MGIPVEKYYEIRERLAKASKTPPQSLPSAPHAPIDVDLTIRQSTDEARLNKTERAYLAYLRVLNPPFIGIQNITLKLADDCRLTPDFNYKDANGRIVFVDVKGFQREDALIKMKVAARLYRWADFVIVKRAGTGWDVTEVKP